MTSHWRQVAAPIIVRVLQETAGKAEREIRAALRAAYPFGVRRHHPYRIWIDEIRVQRGQKKVTPRGRPGGTHLPADERQGRFWEGV
jgi:hypothetical protein